MAKLRFDDRVAIVTGAGGGLGREYARLLASRGARVLVNDYGGDTRGRGRSEEPAAAVAKEIEAAGGVAASNAESVAESAGGSAIVQDAFDRWGRVDIVVHNAGIGAGTGAFEDLRDEEIHAVIGTHLFGAFHVLRPAWRIMKAQGYGRVVNTSSSTALGVDGSFDYPSAKAGLIGLSRSLAVDGKNHGIKVNVIMPLAYTRMAAGVRNRAVREWMEGTFPPRKVAALVAYLCHEEVPVTGDVFSVGGGRAARITTSVYPGFKEDEPSLESVRDHWQEVMAGGDPLIALDGAVDAALMDDGYAAIDGASLRESPPGGEGSSI
ncbi:MAG: SDR family NAD(P)-dependent oxidoreductase [bacterium]|nr:SDR family NAD(P)-dependent oxidoreductase [bacterium]